MCGGGIFGGRGPSWPPFPPLPPSPPPFGGAPGGGCGPESPPLPRVPHAWGAAVTAVPRVAPCCCGVSCATEELVGLAPPTLASLLSFASLAGALAPFSPPGPLLNGSSLSLSSSSDTFGGPSFSDASRIASRSSVLAALSAALRASLASTAASASASASSSSSSSRAANTSPPKSSYSPPLSSPPPTTSSTASVPFALSAMGANSGPPRASSSSSCFAAISSRSFC
mmetsp:Transcript_15439/g.35826  ORF Transcript_15439/g.35826 Transcript_15439/m.35826 type:complete len:227 (-) Transcript_15439:692-1372(-)